MLDSFQDRLILWVVVVLVMLYFLLGRLVVVVGLVLVFEVGGVLLEGVCVGRVFELFGLVVLVEEVVEVVV